LKKGSISSEMTFWIWRLIPTMVVLFFLGLFLFLFLDQEIKIIEIETEVLTNKLIYECLVFEEDGRKHIGTIDMEKFTKAHLSQCARKENLGYKATIGNKSISIMNAEFSQFFEVCNSVESFECQKEHKFVLVKDNQPTTVIVEVIKNKE